MKKIKIFADDIMTNLKMNDILEMDKNSEIASYIDIDSIENCIIYME